MSDQWLCGYRIDFSDGGQPESRVLHIGTKEDCERLADLLPAISYSGDRPIVEAHMIVMPSPDEAP